MWGFQNIQEKTALPRSGFLNFLMLFRTCFCFRSKEVFMVLILIVVTFIVFQSTYRSSFSPNFISTTHGVKHIQKTVFEDIKNIKPNTLNIFFIESSCGKKIPFGFINFSKVRGRFDGRGYDSDFLNLNPRQACSVESTARKNPDRLIYILYTCSLSDHFVLYAPQYIKHLFTYENVKIVRLDLETIFEAKPVQQIFKKLKSSSFPVEQLSDILRLITLLMFGGTYLDFDVLTMKPLKELGTDYIGLENSTIINGAVINVGPKGKGHDIMFAALQILGDNFEETRWGASGPLLLTKVILKHCNLSVINETFHGCDNFRVLEKDVFYPLHWKQEFLFFKPANTTLLEKIKNSYTVHFWNKLTQRHVVVKGSNQLYSLLAIEFCPSVFDYVDYTF